MQAVAATKEVDDTCNLICTAASTHVKKGIFTVSRIFDAIRLPLQEFQIS
jgi:hypothetical protein